MVSSKRSARLRPAVPPQRRDGDPIGGPGAVDLRKRPRVDLDKAPPAAVSLRKRPRVELRKRPKVSLVKVRPPAGRPPLRQRVRSAALSTREWSRRPVGRMVLPGVALLVLIALATAAGMYIVPNTGSPVAREVPGDAASPSGDLPSGFDDDGLVAPPLPGGGVPTRTGPSGTVPPGLSRPADALLSWAAAVSPKVAIPVPALQAYGVAELAMAQSNPGCNLKWTTLAGIGKVESNHGSAQGARLASDGRVSPPIIGLPLDGQGGRKRINDTDGGRLDADTLYDRAIGPMQFIPSTWNSYASDADGDLVRDPHDLDDAALAAGYYLCAGGRDLSTAGGWWAAVLSYNQVQTYADSVFTAANDYGQRSRV